jgi:tripartite-type tricarboxylate transporter receptor subunit TctC
MASRLCTRRFVLAASASAVASGLVPSLSRASTDASFPSRPVTILVPFAPGGGTDIVARLLANELSKKWKLGVIVENKAGAGGQIGASTVARSAADGHTLLLGITTLIQAPSLYKSLPYDVFKDFAPLAQLATTVNFLTVPAASPIHSYKDFLAFAKSRQGKISFGSNGNAGSSHLQGSLFNAAHKLDMVHVPYNGSGPLLTALLGQQIDCAFVDIAPLRPHVVSGKLRVLAVTGPKRSAFFPDTPTFDELGIHGFEPVGWFSLFAPAGVPEPIRSAISTSVMQAMRAPEIVKRVEELGLTPSQMTQQAFAESMQVDLLKWQKMIQAGNVRVD